MRFAVRVGVDKKTGKARLLGVVPVPIGRLEDPPICGLCATAVDHRPVLMEWLGLRGDKVDEDVFYCPQCGARDTRSPSVARIGHRLHYYPPRCYDERWASIGPAESDGHARVMFMAKADPDEGTVHVHNRDFHEFKCQCGRRLRVLDRNRKRPFLFDVGVRLKDGDALRCSKRLRDLTFGSNCSQPLLGDFDVVVEGRRYLVAVCLSCRTPYYRPFTPSQTIA
jgi:hypothetical protein